MDANELNVADQGWLLEKASEIQFSSAEHRVIRYLFNIAEYDIAGMTFGETCTANEHQPLDC